MALYVHQDSPWLDAALRDYEGPFSKTPPDDPGFCAAPDGGRARAPGHAAVFRAERPTNRVYFYNLKTKTLFAASDRLLPPIRTESGPDTGVKAYVYTCDSRNHPGKRVIVYLENDARRAASGSPGIKNDKSGVGLGLAMDSFGASILVRSLHDETWYPRNSPQGLAIMKAGMKSCGSDHPIICLP